MTGEAEAAGDALTGGIIAKALSGSGPVQSPDGAPVACRNCRAALAGAYCATCGQSAHIHRSLRSLGHDILHGVMHFEGRFWNTLPELFFRPGRLTRRYIDGERAKFVSPMALFLFSVFLMFAVFSMVPDTDADPSAGIANVVQMSKWEAGNQSAIRSTDEQIVALRSKLDDPALPAAQRADIDKRIAELEAARAVMAALGRGDFEEIGRIKAAQSPGGEAEAEMAIDIGWPALERQLLAGARAAKDNPQLLFYKLKTNGYKFSWALIPMSVPFLWLLFFWRRDINLYDHAIFATYSISFMMMLMIVLSLLATFGVSAAIWGSALALVPPLHMYKQLRGAYGLSRPGAMVRLFFLLLATMIVSSLFAVLLLLVGVLG